MGVDPYEWFDDYYLPENGSPYVNPLVNERQSI